MSTAIADSGTSPSPTKEKYLYTSEGPVTAATPTTDADVPGAPNNRGDAESLMSVSEQIALAEREGLNPAFYAKVLVLNAAIADTGMGRYQWELFMSSGFGWMADNLCESGAPGSERSSPVMAPTHSGWGAGGVQEV